MLEYFIKDQIIGIILFQIVITLVVLSNRRILHRSRQHSPTLVFPLVSILVPARNEERNITRCVQSLLALDYPSFELLVLDDQSDDSTRSILEGISENHPQLKILDGEPPNGNLLGKNWACSQLARHSQGELLLFTDADTVHQPQALKNIVTAMLGEQADLITGFPHQAVPTWGERLLVPFFSWALYCFMPLALAYRLRSPFIAGAVGQMMLFRREAYLAIGGHEGVGSSIVDDMMLARQIKAAGFCWRMTHIADLISCRMYHNYGEAFNGFVKNMFAAFDFRFLPYLFVFTWLGIVFWLPLIALLLMLIGQAPQGQAYVPAVSVTLSLFLWLIPYIDMGIPFGLAFIYPITILANEWVAFQSLRRSLNGNLSWKGRELSRQRWKWL